MVIVISLLAMGVLGDYISVGKKYLKSIIDIYFDGHYISYNTKTFYHIQENHKGTIWVIWDIILIVLQRILVYWYPIKENLSFLHVVINIIQLVPLYILTIFSVYLIIKRKMKQYYFLIVCMFTYNVAQALMWMDCEYRYRIPVFVFMILICQVGMIEINRKIRITREKMKLIIQIPCYNEAETIEIALNDLPKQIDGIDEIEYLIINDGSIDNTVEVAQKWGVHYIVNLKRNKGLAKGFMAGLDACLRR